MSTPSPQLNPFKFYSEEDAQSLLNVATECANLLQKPFISVTREDSQTPSILNTNLFGRPEDICNWIRQCTDYSRISMDKNIIKNSCNDEILKRQNDNDDKSQRQQQRYSEMSKRNHRYYSLSSSSSYDDPKRKKCRLSSSDSHETIKSRTTLGRSLDQHESQKSNRNKDYRQHKKKESYERHRLEKKNRNVRSHLSPSYQTEISSSLSNSYSSDGNRIDEYDLNRYHRRHAKKYSYGGHKEFESRHHHRRQQHRSSSSNTSSSFHHRTHLATSPRHYTSRRKKKQRKSALPLLIDPNKIGSRDDDSPNHDASNVTQKQQDTSIKASIPDIHINNDSYIEHINIGFCDAAINFYTLPNSQEDVITPNIISSFIKEKMHQLEDLYFPNNNIKDDQNTSLIQTFKITNNEKEHDDVSYKEHRGFIYRPLIVDKILRSSNGSCLREAGYLPFQMKMPIQPITTTYYNPILKKKTLMGWKYFVPYSSIRANVIAHFKTLEILVVYIHAVEILEDSNDVLQDLNNESDFRRASSSSSSMSEGYYYSKYDTLMSDQSTDHRKNKITCKKEETTITPLNVSDHEKCSSHQHSLKTIMKPYLGLLHWSEFDSKDTLCLPPTDVLVDRDCEGGVVFLPRAGTYIRAYVASLKHSESIMQLIGKAWDKHNTNDKNRCLLKKDAKIILPSQDFYESVGCHIINSLGIDAILTFTNPTRHLTSSNSGRSNIPVTTSFINFPLGFFPIRTFHPQNNRLVIGGTLPTVMRNCLLTSITSDPKFTNPASARYKQQHFNSNFLYQIPSLLPILPLNYYALSQEKVIQKTETPLLDNDTSIIINPFSIMNFSINSALQFIIQLYNQRDILSFNQNILMKMVAKDRRPLHLQIATNWGKQMVSQGVTLARKHQHNEAIEWYNFALSHDPKCVDAFVARGASHANQGSYEKALADFNAALELEPNHINAREYKEKTIKKEAAEKVSSLSAATRTTFCLDWQDEAERLRRYAVP